MRVFPSASQRFFGFDAPRLPINWSGLEPTEQGGFDAGYLAAVRRVLDDAAAAGLLVLVDFHQEAASKEIGEDGAPLRGSSSGQRAEWESYRRGVAAVPDQTQPWLAWSRPPAERKQGVRGRRPQGVRCGRCLPRTTP
ncbi:MAG: cellulase family glycosylhydrolase [Deltaproteobacteria bacterium]|nr:cellulase family glycosylhydrolase [Deltaproteobacteria bacterium]MBW2532617.1 cellulase family glycosylhydrolase [Deltaproteobacteria bacterium]